MIDPNGLVKRLRAHEAAIIEALTPIMLERERSDEDSCAWVQRAATAASAAFRAVTQQQNADAAAVERKRSELLRARGHNLF